MEFHYDYEICKKCGGECCKKMPGAYTPKDIENIFGSVENAVKSGKVAIDWWEGKTPKYFMRPKTIKSNELYDPSWGGECTHLKENGCELTEEKRPSMCKIMKPYPDNNCRCELPKPFTNDKEYAVHLWKKSGIDLSVYG
uniref:Putative zinc-or iron-chelating protein n=1 Tax=viral metagenome TaxID=1070528 RepID=A0A6M3LEY7_9ZZZZ